MYIILICTWLKPDLFQPTSGIDDGLAARVRLLLDVTHFRLPVTHRDARARREWRHLMTCRTLKHLVRREDVWRKGSLLFIRTNK